MNTTSKIINTKKIITRFKVLARYGVPFLAVMDGYFRSKKDDSFFKASSIDWNVKYWSGVTKNKMTKAEPCCCWCRPEICWRLRWFRVWRERRDPRARRPRPSHDPSGPALWAPPMFDDLNHSFFHNYQNITRFALIPTIWIDFSGHFNRFGGSKVLIGRSYGQNNRIRVRYILQHHFANLLLKIDQNVSYAIIRETRNRTASLKNELRYLWAGHRLESWWDPASRPESSWLLWAKRSSSW